MSEIRTRSTLLGASFPGRRIASLERFVPSPPSKVPAEDEGGGLLFGLFMAPSWCVLKMSEDRGLFHVLGYPRFPVKNILPRWFSITARGGRCAAAWGTLLPAVCT